MLIIPSMPATGEYPIYYRLGETSAEINISNVDENRNAALSLARQARRTINIFTQDMDAPMATTVQETLDEIVQGVDLLQALDNWVQRTAEPDLDLFVALFKVQVEVGGNLADKLQLLGQVLDQRQLKA